MSIELQAGGEFTYESKFHDHDYECGYSHDTLFGSVEGLLASFKDRLGHWPLERAS